MKKFWTTTLALATCLLAGTGRADYTRNVAIMIWNGAEVLDWAGPSEVFAAAANFGRHGDERAFNVYTVSKTKDAIVSQGFVDVLPDYSIDDAPKPDIIVLPGGGTNSVTNDPEFLAWAGEAARNAEIALSVCTGAFVLGESGLLEGKEATTWYNAVDALARQYPKTDVHPGRRFVDNGNIVTTAGVSAGIDGSLHVVARLLGKHVADRTAEYMEYRWAPESYLGKNYSTLNPSLDDKGRLRQQADMFAQDGQAEAALVIYEELASEQPDDLSLQFAIGSANYTLERYPEAITAYVRSAQSERYKGRALYNAACSASLDSDVDRAFELLDSAAEAGMDDAAYLGGDSDLENLHADPRWDRLIQRLKSGQTETR